jgi:mannose-6-phosphate isomerase-like protein (cupin superfamily)
LSFFERVTLDYVNKNDQSPIFVFTEQRPWGSFTQFTNNVPSTVKLLTIHAGEAFSLQYHHHRDEFWHVISGNGMVTCGEETIDATAGMQFTIVHGTNHRIEAKETMLVLEISTGVFEENDIVRVEDKYGRAASRTQ